MKKFLEFMDGKKTFFQAAAGAVVVGLHFAGFIGAEAMASFLALLGLGMGASIRSGMKKDISKASVTK